MFLDQWLAYKCLANKEPYEDRVGHGKGGRV